ncbi:hypothetical protein D3C86_1787980 [compost metagenome]
MYGDAGEKVPRATISPTVMHSHRLKKMLNGLPGPSLPATEMARPINASKAQMASMSFLWTAGKFKDRACGGATLAAPDEQGVGPAGPTRC